MHFFHDSVVRLNFYRVNNINYCLAKHTTPHMSIPHVHVAVSCDINSWPPKVTDLDDM